MRSKLAQLESEKTSTHEASFPEAEVLPDPPKMDMTDCEVQTDAVMKDDDGDVQDRQEGAESAETQSLIESLVSISCGLQQLLYWSP